MDACAMVLHEPCHVVESGRATSNHIPRFADAQSQPAMNHCLRTLYELCQRILAGLGHQVRHAGRQGTDPSLDISSKKSLVLPKERGFSAISGSSDQS